MSSFILRYYYTLKDDTDTTASLLDLFKQHALAEFEANTSLDFWGTAGFYFRLTDTSGKLGILGTKIPADDLGWKAAWELLQGWEDQAALYVEDLMGILTVLTDTTGKWPDLLKAAVPILPVRAADLSYISTSPLLRLPSDKRDNEAIYIFAPESGETGAMTLLTRKLPMMHGQMIYLYQLDKVLLDRNFAICQEKETLDKDLIRILHTKLVMNQPSLNINEELERDIEVLATAFAKLVGDKKLIQDGLKSLEKMLARVESQFLNQPAFGGDKEAVTLMMAAYHRRLDDLSQTYSDLSLAEDNYQAAIEVVQSKIQVMNSRTNISTQEQIRELLNVNTDMQKKSLVFQYAAGLIEFIVLAYYSLAIWSHLSRTAAEIIPSWEQLVLLILFSADTVLLTHYLAEYMQGEVHVRKKLYLAAITLVIIVAFVLVGTMIALGKAPH